MRVGSARFRIGGWQGSADMAYLAPITAAATLAPAVLAAVRARLRDQGYGAVVTAALAPAERDRLMSDGFGVVAELIVLSRDLRTPPQNLPSARGRTRRGRRSDVAEVLRLDGEAFGHSWRLDADGLREARRATPAVRWRVVRGPRVTAFSVTGRAGSWGCLQRLAVARACQGRGLGTLLVTDALDWLRRGGASTAMVNTQPDNERALWLYQRCGFRVEPDRLAVMQRILE